ncbi:MAG: 30S ribosomal protein S8 [Verrucomicrobiales bacterium]|nr:30S ribosomal protein S8 [Verrucomicrobiales bacterium]
MTDPIADFLTRLRNANRALLPTVELPHSRLKEGIARILLQEGYLADCAVEGAKLKKLRLKLKYQGRQGVITGLRRVSRPGLRHYANVGEIPRVLGGLGVAVLSTSRGVMTGTEARKQNLGGEVLCYVW